MPNLSYDLTLILAPPWDVTRPWTASAYICQYARALKCNVQYIDLNIRLYHWGKSLGCGDLWANTAYLGEWDAGLFDFLANMLDLDEIAGDTVAFTVASTNLPLTIELAKKVRERHPRKKILFGGHGVFLPEQVARIPVDAADAVCRGEGEHTLRDVLDKEFQRLETIPGLYLPTENGWKLTQERELIDDLDTIPWPTYEEIDPTDYETGFIPIVGSRGCVNKCKYCYDRYLMHHCYRTRSGAHIVDEMESLAQRHRVDHFPHNDAVMNGSVQAMEERADEVLRRGLQIEYWGNFMVRHDMSDELLRKLRKSGFSIALIGVESGSPATLKAMAKRHNPEMAADFVKRCHDAGIQTELNFIVGYPTETEQHFSETLDFIKNNRPYIDKILSAATLQLVPSELWHQRNDFGIVTYEESPRTSWHTADMSNTPEIRQERLHRLVALGTELGLMGQDLMGDYGATKEGFASLMDKLVAAYISFWRKKEDCSSDQRAEALQAARPWRKKRRNRRIAAMLDRVGLWESVQKLRGKTHNT